MRSVLAILAIVLLGSACGVQPQLGAASGEPPGPLASYTGYMYADAPPGYPVQARFAWYHDPPAERPSNGELAGEVAASVEPTPWDSLYRAAFWRAPTSGFVQLAAGEVSLARGSVVALTADSAPRLLGTDVSHWVIYLSADVPQQSLTAWWLGRTGNFGSGPSFRAGFHYVAVTPLCLTGDLLDACAAELQSAGLVSDAEAAKALCAQPFRLREVPWDEPSQLHLGTTDLACP